MTMTRKAAMSSGAINDLPDSAFAYIEPGGTKDDDGKTTPRSLRHFPIHDAAHVRNALAQLAKSPFEAKARAKVEAAAKRFGIGEPAQKGSMSAYEASRGSQALSTLFELAAGEADEPDQLAMLERSIEGLTDWINAECAEIGQPDDELMATAPMKAWHDEMKAEPLNAGELDRWLAGKRPRRVLMVPFAGPLPGGKAGLDLDGDFFDEATDLYGGFPALMESRDRLVDWHHDNDPTGVMKGAIIGRVVMDVAPEKDGLWADFWANAGERRRQLVATLESRGIPLFGSSQAVETAVRKSAALGGRHIDVWPIIRHTITTSPQNTFATVPPLKALLAMTDTQGALSIEAVHAAMLGLDGAPIAPSAAAAGNAPGNASGLTPLLEARLRSALDALTEALL